MASSPGARLTAEEYLELEREAPEKHEFVDGVMVAMAGGSPRHARITANILSQIGNATDGTQCLPFSSEVRVCLDQRRLISYPDVTVVCGPPEFLDTRRDVIKNPSLVVEVLSPSTEDCDRGKTATFYPLLPSLRDFLLFEQEPVFVEQNRRLEDGTWQVIVHQDADSVIHLQSLGVDLAVAAIYKDLEWY